IVMRGRLTVLVQLRRPIIKIDGAADEIACGNDRVGMESREEELPIEAIHAAAEADQAIENVLAVEQMFEPGGVHGCLDRRVERRAALRAKGRRDLSIDVGDAIVERELGGDV